MTEKPTIVVPPVPVTRFEAERQKALVEVGFLANQITQELTTERKWKKPTYDLVTQLVLKMNSELLRNPEYDIGL